MQGSTEFLRRLANAKYATFSTAFLEALWIYLQAQLDSPDWNYENARSFVGTYVEYERKNARAREEARSRDQYITNLANMLEKNKKTMEDTELWGYVGGEYLEIERWFAENRQNPSALASSFKEKGVQLENLIGFFTKKLVEQREEAARKAEEAAKQAAEAAERGEDATEEVSVGDGGNAEEAGKQEGRGRTQKIEKQDNDGKAEDGEEHAMSREEL